MIDVTNDARAARTPVPTSQQLRHLLKAGRRASRKMSQRQAAQLAGISPIYWQRIESCSVDTVPADTLASMFLVTGITAGRLRDEGYDQVASALDELAAVKAAEVSAEDYLAGTPGATDEEVTALRAVWRAMRAGRTPDPLEPDFTRHARNREP